MNMTDDEHAFSRFAAARPVLTGCRPLHEVIALPARTLLHAGPRFKKVGDIVDPILNAAAVSAVVEGWADSVAAAKDHIARGNICLEAAQDFGVVTPLAFVVSPTTNLLCAEDRAGLGARRFSPVNDGPPGGALRFGVASDLARERLRLLRDLGGDLNDALAEPVDLTELMASGLAHGDDLHGQVSATSSHLRSRLGAKASSRLNGYLAEAQQFALNAIMAACAVMLSAAAGSGGGNFIVGAGGNGRDFGWRLASNPSTWRTSRAPIPVGQRFHGTASPLRAIGDSAVIDACGFGAAALRFNPEFRKLADVLGAQFFDVRASDAFFGRHPCFPADLRLGFACVGSTQLNVMLAMLDEDGEHGLIGRGIACCDIHSAAGGSLSAS